MTYINIEDINHTRSHRGCIVQKLVAGDNEQISPNGHAKLTGRLCHSLSTRLLMTRNDRLVINRRSLPLRHVKCAVSYVLVGQCCEKNVFESWRMNECTRSSCKKKTKPLLLLPKKILHSPTLTTVPF